MIADDLRAKFVEQNLTIQSVSNETGLDRSFLSRLLSGKTPPRTRRGRRNADRDPRYLILAEAVGLEPHAFISDVCQEQKAAASASPRAKQMQNAPATAESSAEDQALQAPASPSTHRILARLASEVLPDESWSVKLQLVPLFQELVPRTASPEGRAGLLQHLRTQGPQRLLVAPSSRSNASGRVCGVEVMSNSELGQAFQVLGDACIRAARDDTMAGLQFAEVFYRLGTIDPEQALGVVREVPLP